ncbi:MAG: hypothetical protein AVDCRST_MAG49-3604 [uncultured Thermomicrobiales bacterium]|uniref:Uncharacterized protein n=1 Tax=uncultured Thermomicrobiales bacterium TaxID=1645740 RepID=A0A6J4V7M0_9BACT|nr:MAG: hypothetical protein AVDCRST_MAG49-3604 [uncultured Thermomicrobiales bacterium]
MSSLERSDDRQDRVGIPAVTPCGTKPARAVVADCGNQRVDPGPTGDADQARRPLRRDERHRDGRRDVTAPESPDRSRGMTIGGPGTTVPQHAAPRWRGVRETAVGDGPAVGVPRPRAYRSIGGDGAGQRGLGVTGHMPEKRPRT